MISNILSFQPFDYAIFAINLILLIFSRPLVSGFRRTSDKGLLSTKLWALRTFNIVLFLLYVSSPFFSHPELASSPEQNDLTKNISLTGLTFLLAFIVSHLLHLFIVRKFGREKEIDETSYRVKTYQSEVFGLLVTVVALITSVVIVINIWGVSDWLQATSVLGILAILIFSTKDVWVPDNIHGLILLYNGHIEPGAVVKVDEYDLLAIAVHTTLTQSTFRDLRKRHLITLPNSRLRNAKIEVLGVEQMSRQRPAEFCRIQSGLRA